MPVHEFECDRKHVTERVFKITADLPAWIRCPEHGSSTHYAGCAKDHVCRLRARRRTVYRVGVGGDLPTRGAF